MLRNFRIPSKTNDMDPNGRDTWDDDVTTNETWVSVVFPDFRDRGTDWEQLNKAERWAKDEFGEGFLRLGKKFFFDNDNKLVLFQLRWF